MLCRLALSNTLRSICARTVSLSPEFGIRRILLLNHFLGQSPKQYSATSGSALSTLQPRQRLKDTLPTPDTIYALSTASGRAAIAIVRISGPACLDIYGGLCPDKAFPHPRHATLRKLVDPDDAARVLDSGALVLYFPSPATATGEDILELHVHGGPAIVRSVLDAIPRCMDTRPRKRTSEYSSIRAAEAGEFTKRAFYNNRIDLTQAEALGETLAAETEQQRKLAIAGTDNELSSRYEIWRNLLLLARGELEALIDFSEDQHFDESPAEFTKSVTKQVAELKALISIHIKNATRGELLRNGISVALLGPPNAGKSSLLNCIVGREAAIVNSEAGTTRDIVDVSVDLGGWLVRLGDMAGIRAGNLDVGTDTGSTVGVVEREGIRRAKQRALQSDVVVVLVSLVRTVAGFDFEFNSELVEAVEECRTANKAIIFAINKTDMVPTDQRAKLEEKIRQGIASRFGIASPLHVLFVSCKQALTAGSSSTEGTSDPGDLQNFLQALMSTFSAMTSVDIGDSNVSSCHEDQSYWATSLAITHRQSSYLQECLVHLENFLAQMVPSCTTTNPSRDMINIGAEFSHHVDGHDDLVGETMPGESLAEHGSDSVYASSHIYTRPPTGSGHPPKPSTTYTGSGFSPPYDTASRMYSEKATFDVVTAAEHLRYAGNSLAKITGRFGGGDVEDVLGVVFEK